MWRHFILKRMRVNFSPLVYVSAETFYSEDPNTIIRGLMLSNGGMLISELEIIGGETGREASLVIVSPPRLKDQGVTVLRDAMPMVKFHSNTPRGIPQVRIEFLLS